MFGAVLSDDSSVNFFLIRHKHIFFSKKKNPLKKSDLSNDVRVNDCLVMAAAGFFLPSKFIIILIDMKMSRFRQGMLLH